MANRHVTITLMAAVAAATTLTPVTPTSAARSQSHVAPAAAAIQTYFDERARDGTFSGCVLILRQGRRVFQGSYGVAEQATREKISIRTKFNIASLGKFLTRIAIFQLIEQGKIRFDDKVGRFSI